MSPISKTTLQELETQYMQDAEFATAMQELEPGYQVARLRIMRGLSQKELAELTGTKQPAIARLESGEKLPSLSFLRRVAEALGASVELHLQPHEQHG